jgi:hypothetical protein
MALKRTAKSCRSDAPGSASSLREEAQATVSNKRGHRGEREVSRKTIARGMPGDFRCDRGDYARVFVFITHEAAGASAPGIPHALVFLRADASCIPRAHPAARMRRRVCNWSFRSSCPAIVVCLAQTTCTCLRCRASTSWLHPGKKTWMAGTKPGHDGKGCLKIE